MRIYDYNVPAGSAPLGSTSGVSSAQKYAGGRKAGDSLASSDHTALSVDGAALRSGAQARAARFEALTASVRSGSYSVDPAAISRSLISETLSRAE